MTPDQGLTTSVMRSSSTGSLDAGTRISSSQPAASIASMVVRSRSGECTGTRLAICAATSVPNTPRYSTRSRTGPVLHRVRGRRTRPSTAGDGHRGPPRDHAASAARNERPASSASAVSANPLMPSAHCAARAIDRGPMALANTGRPPRLDRRRSDLGAVGGGSAVPEPAQLVDGGVEPSVPAVER